MAKKRQENRQGDSTRHPADARRQERPMSGRPCAYQPPHRTGSRRPVPVSPERIRGRAALARRRRGRPRHATRPRTAASRSEAVAATDQVRAATTIIGCAPTAASPPIQLRGGALDGRPCQPAIGGAHDAAADDDAHLRVAKVDVRSEGHAAPGGLPCGACVGAAHDHAGVAHADDGRRREEAHFRGPADHIVVLARWQRRAQRRGRQTPKPSSA